jgi:hypothetical protein
MADQEFGDNDNVIAQTVVNKPTNLRSTQNLRIFPMKLMLNTNLPNISDPIHFQFDMLYHPNLEKGRFSATKYTVPYFTDTVKYPMDILSQKLFSDRVHFFFNKTRFNKVLRKTMIDYVDMDSFDESALKDDDTTNNSEKQKKEEQRALLLQDNADHNIKCMLTLLFPIADELHNVFKTTYDHYILNVMSPEIFTLRNIDPITFLNPKWLPLYNYFAPRKYEPPITEVSYLKHDNTKYLIADVIWQNDLVNHPVYRKFVSTYYDKLQEKRNNYRKIRKQYIERQKVFVSLIDKHRSTLNDMIKSLIKNVAGKHPDRKHNEEYLFHIEQDVKFNQKENTKREILAKMINYIGSVDDILKGYAGTLDGSSSPQSTPLAFGDLNKSGNHELLNITIESILNAYIDYTNYNKDIDSTMKIVLKDNTRVLTELYNTAVALKTLRLIDSFITDGIRRLDLSETNDDGSAKTKLELDILRVLNQNYKYYVELNNDIVSSLKNVVEPLRRSSNTKLQAFLKQLAVPNSADAIDPYMLIDIYDKYISSIRIGVNPDYIEKYMNVGVSTIINSTSEKDKDNTASNFSGEMPEIYVYMNLVKKDDYEKTESRNCIMSDDRITNNLKQILYSNTMMDHSFPETNVYRGYKLLGNQDTSGETPKSNTPKPGESKDAQAVDDVHKKGGKRYTRKYRHLRRHTRHRRRP